LALSGAYNLDINLSDGDGVYRIITASCDNAGNWSGDLIPAVEVILDAVNEDPQITLIQPDTKETIGLNNYEVKWQALDPDPSDTLSIDIQYTNNFNQTLLDNFDSGYFLNCIEAWSGSWNSEDASIEVIFNNSQDIIYDDEGMSLELSYDVTQPNTHAGYWSGIYTKPDMQAYEYLSFLVKGNNGGEIFEVGLKDTSYNETKLLITGYLTDGVTTEWQRVMIPLADFSGVNISSLDNFSLTFTHFINSGSGTIYVDEVRFIKWQSLAEDEENDGSYLWDTLSMPQSESYLLKVTAADTANNIAVDESDDYFEIGHNLALNKPASASSCGGTELSVDGDYNTRWGSEFSDPQWYEIDLGEEQSLNKVILRWEAAYGKSYSIEVSNDGINWDSVYSTTTGNGGVEKIEFEEVSARYIRMYGTERGTEWGYSFWEFEVYYVFPARQTVASSEGADVLGNYVIDGDLNTRWSSNATDDEWIYIDFGMEKSFNTAILNWENAYAQVYELHISNDAANWNTIYSTATGDGGEDIISVGEQTARYLKMKGIQRGTEWGYSLWEISVQ
jgi:hypothetical protein